MIDVRDSIIETVREFRQTLRINAAFGIHGGDTKGYVMNWGILSVLRPEYGIVLQFGEIGNQRVDLRGMFKALGINRIVLFGAKKVLLDESGIIYGELPDIKLLSGPGKDGIDSLNIVAYEDTDFGDTIVVAGGNKEEYEVTHCDMVDVHDDISVRENNLYLSGNMVNVVADRYKLHKCSMLKFEFKDGGYTVYKVDRVRTYSEYGTTTEDKVTFIAKKGI